MKAISQLVTALAIAAVSTAASAAATVYSSSAAFLAQIAPNAYTETFDGLPDLPPNDFSNGTFSYSLSAPGDLFAINDFLTTSQINEPLTISFTSGNVRAVGGNFFASDFDGDFSAQLVQLTLSDGTTASFTPTSFGDSFRGFIAFDGFITSLTISGPGQSLYASLDNLTVGTLPEPASLALAGLALAGLAATRRRRVC